jgi:6-phosphogluconolactonase
MVVAAQKGGSLESWEIKTNDRHGLLYETNFSYTVAEPVTIVV